MTKNKRFELIYIDEDDDWSLYDNKEEVWHDVDLRYYQKEVKRIERNHQNLHQKYEELEAKYKKCKAKLTKLEGNESSARRIYENLKDCFER